MAAPYNPPVKGQDFAIKVALRRVDDTNRFKVNPQITAGDFKLDRWEEGSPSSTLTNLTTLPVVDPPGSMLVLIRLSAAEFSGDIVTIVGSQQGSPNEWADFVMSIPTQSADHQPTFTVPNKPDVNIQYVNEVEVQGDGTLGNEWGPVP